MYKLRDECVKAGLSEFDYWRMTVGEVSRWVDSYNFQYRQHLKDNIQTQYMASMVIVKGVNKVLTGKGDIPTINELYPELFPEEAIIEERTKKSIANFLNFANSFNKRKQNDNRRTESHN